MSFCFPTMFQCKLSRLKQEANFMCFNSAEVLHRNQDNPYSILCGFLKTKMSRSFKWVAICPKKCGYVLCIANISYSEGVKNVHSFHMSV